MAVRNATALTAFVKKYALGMPCLLRLAEPAPEGEIIVSDIEYAAAKFRVRTILPQSGGKVEQREYPYMSVVKVRGKSKLVLSDYISYEKLAPGGTPYLLLDSWSAADPKEAVRAANEKVERLLEFNK